MELLEYISEKVVELLSIVLKLDAKYIYKDEVFSDYGVDSIIAVSFIEQLNEQFHISLRTVDFFDYSSVSSLSHFIKSKYGQQIEKLINVEKQEKNQQHVVNQEKVDESTHNILNTKDAKEKLGQKINFSIRNKHKKEKIAIVGISAKFAHSDNYEQYWENIREGKDLVERTTRWDLSKEFPEGTEYCKYGSYLEDFDKFDPLFFNISGQEATYMNPNQRIFLQEAWNALEDAGYAGDMVKGSNCGVYCGSGVGDYHNLFSEDVPAQSFWGITDSIVPARIAYFLDMKGPAVAVDTACSSSLVAIHLAAKDLREHETDMAVAGGVFVQSTAFFHKYCERAHMLSHYGRCQTFDDNADGIALGEGSGAIVLKRLSDAVRDRDHIYGIIKASGINQDGATNGITAPSLNSQVRLQKSIYEKYNINPEKIQMFEAHGTGTKLGDPIEYEALSESFSAFTDKKNYCAMGSVKTNIGHSITSAGIAGVLKILLSMKHKEIPPTIHYRKGNTHIDFENSPFYINTTLKKWNISKGETRCAAINGFGFSGTNAHMVLEEAPEITVHHSEKAGYIIALSARNQDQLLKQAENLLNYCKKHSELDLGNMSFTLLTARKHFNHRLACVVSSKDMLIEVLQNWHDSKTAIRVYTNVVQKNETHIQPTIINYAKKCIENLADCLDEEQYLDELNLIAELFVNGFEMDYDKLFKEDGYWKVSLPTYPFAKNRYWVKTAIEKQNSIAQITEKMHPLIHKNASSFFEQKFTSVFTGKEAFLADHVVNNNKILPGVAYIEMAVVSLLASLEEPINLSEADKMITIENLYWLKPITVNDNDVEVSIGLSPDDKGKYEFIVYDYTSKKEKDIYCRGKVEVLSGTQDRYIDIDELNSICNKERIEKKDYYEQYERAGIQYGPAHRGIDYIKVGSHALLISLSLPEEIKDTRSRYILHPTLMDAAFQGSMAMIALDYTGEDEVSPFLPYQLEKITIYDSCNHFEYAYYEWAEEVVKNSHIRKANITLCNKSGKVCAVLQGFCLKELQLRESDSKLDKSMEEEQLIYSIPKWDCEILKTEETDYYNRQEKTIIVTGVNEDINEIKSKYAGIEQLVIEQKDDIKTISEKLSALGNINHIIWLANAPDITSVEDENIIKAQEGGVIKLFRFVKVLLALKYGNKKLKFTVITIRAIGICKGEDFNPINASIHGFVGSMQKEMPTWKVKLVDIEQKDKLQLDDVFMKVPLDWNTHVYRNKRWYVQKILPIDVTSSPENSFKKEGIYVIIGGAGGLGEVLSKYLSKKYHAHIIWIGRRKKDEQIQNKINEISQYGYEPMYISGDATSREDMEAAYKQIKQKYNQINGIVHSAAVLRDKSLYNMDEESFKIGLASKVNVSVRMAQVFKTEKLDFVLFYSSYQSLIRAPGQSNYASGCVFKDNYAIQLGNEWLCNVKIVNWSYWGYIGMVASEEYRKRMLQVGMTSLTEEDGTDAVERLLSMPFNQLAVLKTNRSNKER
ncbi:type I polyketide synthase [Anaeromicropila populeti]|uniref:Acyl transferase domain-containing protein n=1 Tax=Anaeromicropila populeti TaxID=37658 RepID=A0A1I6IZX6_9FIRM|nr:type I polyketide synthase [Anaeromicropila populeti]SFR72228.1 Acyl transferase domain-containing protein [Anaeromicropila populeti]